MTGKSVFRGWMVRAIAAALALGLTTGAAAAGAADRAAGAIASAKDRERVRLIISRDEQRVDVYRGNELVTSSPISTGRRGYETPLGVYSILGKKKVHYSNLYGSAPMPYMQRITWSGIALHAGRVPGYPASHGCIRLPRAFAVKLFGMTEVGADVIITSTPKRPTSVVHDLLFQPQPPDADIARLDYAHAPGATPASAGIGLADIEYIAARTHAYATRSRSPVRVLITWRNGRQRMMDIQVMLRELGHDPGDVDGYFGRNTANAIQSFQRASELPPTGMLTDDLVAALYRAVGRAEVKGHLYVRQDYRDVFDTPITIAETETPLGTHVYTLGAFDDGDKSASWSTLTVAGETSPTAVLDRVTVPGEIRTRISEMLTPGSSLIVSDAGFGRETGKGTDFIVQPR